MKKILLTTAALAAISTSAFAEVDQFYVRGDLDAYSFSKFKTSNKTTGYSAKIKPKFGLGIDLGVGYYITESVRAELVLNLPFAQKMKGKANITKAANQNTPTGGALTNYGASTRALTVTHKPTVNALLARVSADVLDLDATKIFVTGGLGLAQVKDSVKITGTYTRAAAAATAGATPALASAAKSVTGTTSYKAKNKTNLAWTLGFGGTFNVSEGVHLDVAYSYRDYGKSKKIKSAAIAGVTPTLSAAKFASHNLSAGIRFDI